MRQRILSWLEDLPSWAIVLIVVVSFALRAGYALLISDPMSGPDAPTYRDSAEFISEYGYFTPGIPGIPYWPPGYSLLLSPVAFLWDANWMKVAQLLQVALLTGASLLSWSIIRRWAGTAAANVSLLILLFLPSLTGAAPLLMYEVPLGFFVTLGIWGANGVLVGVAQGKRPWRRAVVSGAGLGVATVMSPKVMLVVLGALVLFAYRRKLAEAGLVLVVSLMPLIPVILRNRIVEGHFGITWELGATMNQRSGNFQTSCSGTGSMFEADPQIVACRLGTYISEPGTFLSSGLSETWNFLWPFTGPQSPGSTWYHGFNIRRLLPTDEPFSQVVAFLDVWQAPLFIAGLLIFFLAGVIASRRLYWPTTVLLLLPALSFWLVTFGVRGDGRFRIPVVLTAVGFVGVAVVTLLSGKRDFAWRFDQLGNEGRDVSDRSRRR